VRTRSAIPLGLLALALVLGGCTSASANTKAVLGYELGVGHVAGLGRVLVDSSGDTLYLYVPDEQGASKCKGICARQWPPLMASHHGRFGPGVQRALVGTVRRTGGGLQVTYNRWPLYTWHLDMAPGEANGEGDDMGLWYAISPSGNAIQ